MQKLYKSISILLSIVMIISLFTIVPFTASAAEGVRYIERWWDNDELQEEAKTCTDYKKLTDYEQNSNHTLQSGWYVADGNVQFRRLTIIGTVNIIVPDGVTMKCRNIVVNYFQNTLNIYGQSQNSGLLEVKDGSNNDAAIGSYENKGCGTINIHGGDIFAQASDDAPGIGCGKNGSSGTVKIYGGKVTAKGAAYGAGIGAGDSCLTSGNVYIYGGEVTATGGKRGAGIGGGNHSDGCSVVILGGTVNATGGDWGAGIGGGNKALGGSLVIGCDAKVTATGGSGGAGVGGGDGACALPYHYVEHGLRFKMYDDDDCELTAIGGDEAAGIGGGNQEDSVRGYIEINGGIVKAYGGTNYGAGIGGGDQQGYYTEYTGGFNVPHGYEINISGGFVTAYGGKRAAGIGGGDKGNGSKLNITGGDIKAYGGENAAGIGGGNGGSGGEVMINDNPIIEAYGSTGGAGIGCGSDGNGGNVSIDNGTVKNATGGDYAAGIGGGNNTTDFGKITINDCTAVNAQGGKRGAGIGGGEKSTAGTVTINGADQVNATGGLGGAGIGKGSGTTADTINVTINGGIVNAKGGDGLFDKRQGITVNCAPAIGGNSFSGTINLNGGNIDATGAKDKHISESNPNIVDYNYVYGTAIGSNSSISPHTGTVNIKAGAIIDTHIIRENNTYSYHYIANAINFIDTDEGHSYVKYDSAYAAADDRVKACGWKAVDIHIEPCTQHGELVYTIKDSEHHNTKCLYCNTAFEDPHNDVLTSWTWGANNKTATAQFTCANCGNTVSVPATVSWGIESDGDRYTATVVHNDIGYSTERLVNTDNGDIISDGVVITFENSDGTIIQSTVVPLGEVPTCTISPRKPGADSSAYGFVGWSDGVGHYVTQDLPEARTNTTYTPIYKYLEQTAPYIDASGAYIPGKEKHYLINGEYYEINEDYSVGIRRDSVDISDFEFELLNDNTYRINRYTDSPNLTELVIPKSYKDNPVTVVGDDSQNKLFTETSPQFTLVLNENIKKIGTNTFWGIKVATVTGDTSSLNQIGQSAFSWANGGEGECKLDIKLDYPGQINLGDYAFDHTILTLRIKHATTFSTDRFYSQSNEYIFTDDHIITPTWQWEDDYSGAALTLECSDTRCPYQETFTAEVTSKPTEGKITYTATVEAMGEIFTDTKEVDTYIVTWQDEDGTELYTDECVPAGSIPEYNGKLQEDEESTQENDKKFPEKDDYTFMYWRDTETDVYTSRDDPLPPVTKNVTYMAVYEITDSIGAHLVGHSLSLSGDIAVNFYMELSNYISMSQSAFMRFTIPTGSGTTVKDILVKDADTKTLDNKTYFVFKCNVAAKEIYSEITAQIHNINATGDESLGNLYTYSVSEYANYLLDHLEVAEYAQAEYLVRAMLTYGDHAEYYFDKTAEKPEDIEDVTIPDEFPQTKHDTLPAYAEFTGASLSLKSETTLSLFFESEQELTLTCEGHTAVTANSGNEYVIRIRDFAAADLNQPITVKVNGADAVTYSPLTYCYKVQQASSNAKLVNTVKALYLYWDAAYHYFNNIPYIEPETDETERL